MRKLKIGIITILIFAFVLSSVGCGSEKDLTAILEHTPDVTPSSAPTLTPTPQAEFRLSDAPELLNLSLLLPAYFEHIDAASEGLSNEDLGLGPEASEVEVFLREEPYQLIYTFLMIIESRIEQAASDSMLRDDEQVKSMLEYYIRLGAEEEGVYDFEITDLETSHPDIGDLSIYGNGAATTYGFYSGFDCLFFRRNDVYLFAYSVYDSEKNKVSLEAVCSELDRRLLL